MRPRTEPERSYPFPWRFERERYSLQYLLARVAEEDVQGNALVKLEALGIPAVPVDVGAKKLRGRAIAALRRAKASTEAMNWVNQGATGAGVINFPDLVGCIPGSGRALFIECKAPEWLEPSTARLGNFVVARRAEEPRPGQLAFLETMHQAGAVVGVIWGPRDLDRILAPHLPPRRP